jgi:hypothetical protein
MMGRDFRLALLLSCVVVGCCSGESEAPKVEGHQGGYDCLMRSLALSYTEDIVLGARGGWNAASPHRKRALALVAHGLRIEQCNATAAARASGSVPSAGSSSPGQQPSLDQPAITLYVATTGDDHAAGTAQAPLATVAGAQAKIRALYATVCTRPAISVLIQPGEYFYGAADPSRHLNTATQYSKTALASFGAQDSGASPQAPIVYAAAQPTAATPVSFIGGLPLKNLSWAPAGSSFPAGAFKATLPAGFSIDVQDQLFLNRIPLVRARTPNGKPWIPLDGFNLSTMGLPGELSGPPQYKQCTGHRQRSSSSAAVVAEQVELEEAAERLALRSAAPGNLTGNCSVVQHGVCLHNARPIIRSFNTQSISECCGNCSAEPKCNTWNLNTAMKSCFLRGSWKPNPGKECISGCVRGACAPPSPPPPRPPPPPTAGTCVPAKVICNSSHAVEVSGVIGTSTASGRALGGAVSVSHCLEHALGLANDFPFWVAQSYGLLAPCNYTADPSCANALDMQYNYPRWFGPWAAGIKFDPTREDTGTHAASTYKWTDADQVVVHAMAVGEWGGVQFRLKSATPAGAGGKTDLSFSHGGYQQARGAAFRHGSSRYYMEGSADFLDTEGEWHFNATTRELYVIPPAEFTAAAELDGEGLLPPIVAALNAAEVLLTQTDTLFEFAAASSENGSRVENIVLANVTLSHTSAQFFRPHEETSGGDYTTHRSGAVKVENASTLRFQGNSFEWIGGNAVVLSASVRGVNVTANSFRWLGTNGVAVQGKTGSAMMDGRDGERMAAAHGAAAGDNGVRLPTGNLVNNNVFADFGIWDKQSACYHKALAPGNSFKNNICFNASRHAVNFQDGFGGGGVAEGNLVFNLNRETKDTTAFNSWNRRNYIASSPPPQDPAVGILVPAEMNQWRRNLVLGRNYFSIGYGAAASSGSGSGGGDDDVSSYCDGLRNDDGASYWNHSNNVLYKAPITFNGGTQIHLASNLLIETAWSLGPTPDVASARNNTFVETANIFTGSGCQGFFQVKKQGSATGIYTGDDNVQIVGTTNATVGPMGFCGMNVTSWRNDTHGEDAHSHSINGSRAGYTARTIVALAREMLYAGQQE